MDQILVRPQKIFDTDICADVILSTFLCVCEYLNFKVHRAWLVSSRLLVKIGLSCHYRAPCWSNLGVSEHQDTPRMATNAHIYIKTSSATIAITSWPLIGLPLTCK